MNVRIIVLIPLARVVHHVVDQPRFTEEYGHRQHDGFFYNRYILKSLGVPTLDIIYPRRFDPANNLSHGILKLPWILISSLKNLPRGVEPIFQADRISTFMLR